MDPGKLIDFLHQYPVWYRWLVFLWIVVGAVLAGVLIVIRAGSLPTHATEMVVEPSKVPAQPTPVPVPTPTPTDSSLTLSAPPVDAPTVQVYFTTLRTLSERFLEKQEFVERMSGRTVEWEGLLESVSQRQSSISLNFTTQGIEPERTVFASLPESLRTKAFSLQKGDVVLVRGKLSLSTPSMPDIEATELTLVRPRAAN